MKRKKSFFLKVFFYSLAALTIIFGTNSSFSSENNKLIPVPGDLTGDGIVDGADYLAFRGTIFRCDGDTGYNFEADYEDDGCINYKDYIIWYDLYVQYLEEYGYPASPVPVTGQTRSYYKGDDGDLQLGVQWAGQRFTDNGDGTVKDHLTGLIWLKNANCFGNTNWYEAIDASNNLATGQCGLSDDSFPGDWHLPNVRELHSLIDYGNYSPALPSGHPFTGVQDSYYWSSTTYANRSYLAWRVGMYYGLVSDYYKDNYYYVWPVRGGND